MARGRLGVVFDGDERFIRRQTHPGLGDGACRAQQPIGEGADDVAPERLGIAFPQRFRPRSCDPAAIAIRNAAPEDIALVAGIDCDHWVVEA